MPSPTDMTFDKPMRSLFILCLLSLSLTSFAQRPPVPNLPYGNQEKVGLSSDSLDALENTISNFEHRDFVGLVIIKDNQLVAEWYYNTFWRKHLLDIRSAGKSITSLLLGVAMKEGLVKSLEQDVYSFFPKEKYPSVHKDFKKIKLKHLLDMASGLDADSDYSETPGNAGNWIGRDEWVQYLLSVPLARKPGEKFIYADINAALIGAIIEETSGMSMRDFAREKVFTPLGIREFYWSANASDQTVAAGNLYLSTLDFAKLGVLVANNGKWADQQLIEEDYIQKLVNRKAYDLTDWSPRTDSYGMFWYKTQRTFGSRKIDYVWASGRGGNHLVVVPEENMVIALTSTAYGPSYQHARPYKILQKILGALE